MQYSGNRGYFNSIHDGLDAFLVAGMMSDEESEVDEDDVKSFKVLRPKWRSQQVTAYYYFT